MDDARFSRRAGASRFVLTLTACLCLLVVFAVLAVRHVLVDIPAEVVHRTVEGSRTFAREIAEDVARAFQIRPRVTVGSRTIVEQDTAVAKMVVIERETAERYQIENSWLHSTKTFEIEGRFKVTAGFDLGKTFEIHLDETASAIKVRLPAAEILGADLIDVKILRDEDGFWNRLTAEDREEAINALRRRVLSRAKADRLDEKARAAAEEKLSRLLTREGTAVTFETAVPRG